MALLQGFEEVSVKTPIGKLTMTITESGIRFNKSTAAALGFPQRVKVLINEQTRQLALQAVDNRSTNAVKFSKPESKQVASVSVKDPMVMEAAAKLFPLSASPEGEVAYWSAEGELHEKEKVVIFNVEGATEGTMKKRGRRAAAAEA
ncbi:hypothetical protein [Bifidobacterium oedipodis]|uniref:Uncharacterized protein n=1 Tax=Bifidobacterium oedipodis TaxID=2675322 RepID=A0A7Y0ENZ2_9BIFI|nr:hypothetical protein [Bifidobacterium sp. DSM 109957]NMM93803.1 hypothetical protein [Bifidobacterium sp. DSM 109957]